MFCTSPNSRAVPPSSSRIAPPPAMPQPEPSTGAEPGARHGFWREKSRGPEEISTLYVRSAAAFSVGSPGMRAIGESAP